MNPQIVSLAEMTPAFVSQRGIDLTATAGDLVVLHGAAAKRLVDGAGDALVMALAGDDALCASVDFRRARALLAHEVRGARGGPIHLSSVYVYLTQVTTEPRARAVIEDVARSLERMGASATVPQSARNNAMRARRAVVRTARPSRRARGTRSVGLLVGLLPGLFG